jgi:hypothetical protein
MASALEASTQTMAADTFRRKLLNFLRQFKRLRTPSSKMGKCDSFTYLRKLSEKDSCYIGEARPREILPLIFKKTLVEKTFFLNSKI